LFPYTTLFRSMIAENRRLRAENKELRRVNEVLRAASAYFAQEIGPTRRLS
ncbi:IS3 family transposase, partial [Mycobacterium xenopi RIVM700367]